MKLIVVVMLLSVGSLQVHASDLSDAEKSARTGTVKGLDEAFGLLAKSDGGDADDIIVAIGKNISRHPRNFLSALKKNKNKLPNILDSLLGNLGPDLVDNFKGQLTELKSRLKALESVKDDSLKAINSECQAELKTLITKRSNLSEQ